MLILYSLCLILCDRNQRELSHFDFKLPKAPNSLNFPLKVNGKEVKVTLERPQDNTISEFIFEIGHTSISPVKTMREGDTLKLTYTARDPKDLKNVFTHLRIGRNRPQAEGIVTFPTRQNDRNTQAILNLYFMFFMASLPDRSITS